MSLACLQGDDGSRELIRVEPQVATAQIRLELAGRAVIGHAPVDRDRVGGLTG